MKFRTLLAATAGVAAILSSAAGSATAGGSASAGSSAAAGQEDTTGWVDAYETGGRVTSRGDAVVNGALFCPSGAVYTLTVQVDQRGGAPVVGAGSKAGNCTGTQTAWTATADAPRRFKPGEALVTAELVICDETTCETVDVRAYTQLTR